MRFGRILGALGVVGLLASAAPAVAQPMMHHHGMMMRHHGMMMRHHGMMHRKHMMMRHHMMRHRMMHRHTM